MKVWWNQVGRAVTSVGNEGTLIRAESVSRVSDTMLSSSSSVMRAGGVRLTWGRRSRGGFRIPEERAVGGYVLRVSTLELSIGTV